ncbi:Cuticle protein 21 [Orchesella cincta]|uniref:Cuticle protein 21 n=1 Tax=Orchesella cincta TaxID=48709 RepID=A0A1D2NGU5_ORCCI|nr:Cuticle protein 21 [Orchesella cincta]
MYIIALALAFVAAASAAPGAPGYAADYYAYPKYSYSYGVKDALTGDAKSAHETRDGGVVKGSYSLVQPDGVLRTVNYVADPIHGFQSMTSMQFYRLT